MSATFWKVFELAISVLENMLLLGFCMDFMQQRPKGKRGKFLWLFAVLVGMIFPALEKYPAIMIDGNYGLHCSGCLDIWQ